MLFYQLAFFVEEILLKIFHQADILSWIIPPILHRLSLLIKLYCLAAQVFHAMLFNKIFEKDGELVLVLLDSPFHARIPVILDGIVCSSLEQVGDVSPFVTLIPVE